LMVQQLTYPANVRVNWNICEVKILVRQRLVLPVNVRLYEQHFACITFALKQINSIESISAIVLWENSEQSNDL
ncbi:MAG: hypothetical protein KTR27_21225, partial [Leptolyngbyaceae cyanobacterium MAG.088]|nr:hypothetical protein [Leptolyngbyaceae cyanobacterium MAG.088]